MKKLIISLLLAAALSSAIAANETKPDIAAIRTLLQDGEKAQQAGHPEKAISFYEAGIRLLNDSYSNPDHLDDTDQKQLAADIQKKKGKLKEAADLYNGGATQPLRDVRSQTKSRLKLNRNSP